MSKDPGTFRGRLLQWNDTVSDRSQTALSILHGSPALHFGPPATLIRAAYAVRIEKTLCPNTVLRVFQCRLQPGPPGPCQPALLSNALSTSENTRFVTI